MRRWASGGMIRRVDSFEVEAMRTPTVHCISNLPTAHQPTLREPVKRVGVAQAPGGRPLRRSAAAARAATTGADACRP